MGRGVARAVDGTTFVDHLIQECGRKSFPCWSFGKAFPDNLSAGHKFQMRIPRETFASGRGPIPPMSHHKEVPRG